MKRITALLLTLMFLMIPHSLAASLTQQKETDHFIFYAADQDISTLEDLAQALEDCYANVTANLNKTPASKTVIEIYPDRASFHAATGRTNAPNWSVGSAVGSKVLMVSPSNAMPTHTYETMLVIAVHEFVHVVVHQFGVKLPSYLNEGIASYEAGQKDEYDIILVQRAIEAGSVPSLTDLGRLTGETGLYEYGYAYVEFIVKTFGYEKVISLLEGKPQTTVLNMDSGELNQLWIEFLKTDYQELPEEAPPEEEAPIEEEPPVEAPNLDTASAWAQAGIQSAAEKGIVPGDIQDDYQATITRAEFCRMAVKWLEYKTGKTIDAILAEQEKTLDPNAFSDTDDLDILAAYALGITSGTVAPDGGKPGVFSPDASFRREEAATMIRRACKAAGMDVSDAPDQGFQDIGTAESWAERGINFCRANRIMNGTNSGNTLFSPKATYTRQESIVAFNNIK